MSLKLCRTVFTHALRDIEAHISLTWNSRLPVHPISGTQASTARDITMAKSRSRPLSHVGSLRHLRKGYVHTWAAEATDRMHAFASVACPCDEVRPFVPSFFSPLLPAPKMMWLILSLIH